MELKYRLIPQITRPLTRFNRTFMELKWDNANFPRKAVGVLIVPLWN